MMEMFVLIKGEPSEPYVCGSQERIERFCLRQRSPCCGQTSVGSDEDGTYLLAQHTPVQDKNMI